MYTVAITRVPVTAGGVYIDEGDRSTLVTGPVILNVVDQRLNSVSVGPIGKTKNIKGRRVQMLSFPDRQASLIFSALTR